MDLWFYIVAGAGVGFAVGLTGVGGGSLMTPLLIFSGIPYHIAIGTDLLYAAITKTGGMITYARRKIIDWRLVGLLAAGSIPASIATGVALKTIFNGQEGYRPILTLALGLMLILTALATLFKHRLWGRANANLVENRWYHRHSSTVTVIAGLVLGTLVTLSSVGAGVFGTAMLLTLYPRLSASNVVGTDLAHAVPLTLVAGLGHFFLLGNVNFQLLAGLLVGSLPAVHFGARLAGRIPHRVLQPILAVLLLIVGVKFAFW